jgi:3-oxoacyl-[acyl-carrier-protein] synthase-3
MTQNVYITRISKYLPNNPVSNDEMENYLGMIKGKTSLSRRIVLRNNGIKTRYYALDQAGNPTHNKAQVTARAVEGLFAGRFTADRLELLACGTTSADHLLPAHAAMVHGLIGGAGVEICSLAGACCTGMQALNYAYLSVLAGKSSNAVVTGSECIARLMRAKNYEFEHGKISELEENPYVAFEKEFLRWMLSDGAAAVLLENQPAADGLSLRIKWVENRSYAHKMPVCMYMGGEKDDDGNLKCWHEYDPDQWLSKSVFAFKQDVKLLGANIIEYGGEFLRELMRKHALTSAAVDYFLPHISSCFFLPKIENEMKKINFPIAPEKIFINLPYVGNVGSASVFLMLEELFHSGKLKAGQQILVMAPESARFSYSYALLEVE